MQKRISLVLVAFATSSMLARAAGDNENSVKTSCPAFVNSKGNVLIDARMFDGEVSENAQLVPDDLDGASRDISGYKNSGRSMHLVCDYRDHSSKDLTVAMPAQHCYIKGKKKVPAWCGK